MIKVLCVATNYGVDKRIWKVFTSIERALRGDVEITYLCGPNEFVPNGRRLKESDKDKALEGKDMLWVWNGKLNLGLEMVNKARSMPIPVLYFERGIFPQEYPGGDWTFYCDGKGSIYGSAMPTWELDSISDGKKAEVAAKTKEILGMRIFGYEGDGKYTLLALQIEGDMRVVKHSSYFQKMQSVIDYVCSRSKIPVLVRKHPLDTNLHYMLPANAGYDKNLNPEMSIKNARNVITINSGLGLQALASGKPVILLGDSEYEKTTIKLRGEGNMPEGGEVQKDKIYSFLAKLYDHQWRVSELVEKKQELKRAIIDKHFPKISVVMATYNADKDYLKQALEALSKQSYKNFELIVVDDGSNSSSEEILKEVKGLAGKYRYFKKEHEGLAVARNYGILKADGSVIAFADDDDVIEKNWLKWVVCCMIEHPDKEVFYGDYWSTNKDLLNPVYHRNPGHYSFETQIKHVASIVAAGATLCKKEVFIKAGLFDSAYNYVVDLEWASRAFQKGIKFQHAGVPAIYYRRHPRSMGVANRQEQKKQEQAVFKRMSTQKEPTAKIDSLNYTLREWRASIKSIERLYKGVKIGVVLPTRGDRSAFLANAKRLIDEQTVQPNVLEVVDDPPISNDMDVSRRYRIGCDRALKQGCDVILFWEDDDWYSSVYIQAMIDGWLMLGKPDLFGSKSTLYYHIKRQKYRLLDHPGRSSAMSMLVTKAVLDIVWCRDNDPFVDIHLWKNLKGEAVDFEERISIGIKHGMGLCGGHGHRGNEMTYLLHDVDYEYLSELIDKESVAFYKKLVNR